MTPVYKLSASSVTGRTNYGSMLAGNPAYEIPGDFESIATVTVGGTSQSSISFTSIPATYTHLQIRAISKSNRTNPGEFQTTLTMRLNSDSGSNYAYHRLIGDGSAASSTGSGSAPYMYFYFGSSSTSPANTFGAGVWDILDYTNTNKYKTVKYLSGIEDNTDGVANVGSGLWMSSSAVTSISIGTDGGYNFTQYSHFALYGIKEAV